MNLNCLPYYLAHHPGPALLAIVIVGGALLALLLIALSTTTSNSADSAAQHTIEEIRQTGWEGQQMIDQVSDEFTQSILRDLNRRN